MNQGDVAALMRGMAPAIKSYIDGVIAPLLKRIEAQECELEELRNRAPEKGEPGRDGRDGVDGRDAEPVSEEQIANAVERYLTANPPPPGKDGSDGADGKDGAPGEKGADGRDGADGVGLAGAMIDRDGELNITLTNGKVRRLGSVIGRDGKDGVDGSAGADGQSWDEMEVRQTSARTIELSFDHGERRNTFELEFPVPLYRGVFTEGEAYQPGDMVTWAGSLWHCNDASPDKPGDGAKAWTLAAKRGRDGKDFAGPQAKAGTVKI